MLSCDDSEKRKEMINIEDFDAEVILLQFIYTGNVPFYDAVNYMAFELFRAAVTYDLYSLKTLC